MSISDSEWKDLKRDANRGGRFGLSWLIIIVLVIAALSISIWAFTVLTSGIKGAGDATIQKNSGSNKIVQDARFQQLFESYNGSIAKIEIAAAAVQTSPNDKTAKVNLTGAQQYCVDIVNQYNALAQSFIAEDFRGTNLPSKLDQSTCIEEDK